MLLNNENVIKIDENISLFKTGLIDSDGKRMNSKFFICLDYDIVEVDAGLAFIEFDTKEEALNYFPKIKDMVVWSRV